MVLPFFGQFISHPFGQAHAGKWLLIWDETLNVDHRRAIYSVNGIDPDTTAIDTYNAAAR